MVTSISLRQGLATAALAAFLAIPSIASAHGTMVKVSDNSTGKTYQVYYAQALVYANGDVSLGAAGYNVTVCSGTITYEDAWNNSYNNYQTIPIDKNLFAYKNGGNGTSLGHSSSNGSCVASPALGSGAGNPAGNNGVGTLISPGTAPHLIGQDGGGLISQDGGGVISNDGGSIAIKDGAYHVMADGRPGVTGSHNPARFACDFVYWPGPPSHDYYDHFTVAPHAGVYLCKSAASATLHLVDGGTWRG